MAEFPLWLLKPEEAARIIILEPTIHVARRKFWHKREMRIRPSHTNRPRTDDLRVMNKASKEAYWSQAFAEIEKEFPTVGVACGPLLRSGHFYSCNEGEDVHNPLQFWHQQGDWAKEYTLDDFEWDVWYLGKSKDALSKRFVAGQLGMGPRLDALVYIRIDKLIDAEIAHCKAMYKMATEVRGRKRRARKPKIQNWMPIGTDEVIALQFKHSGHEIRKIDRVVGSHYEVLV